MIRIGGINISQNSWVKKEIELWCSEGLISPDQAQLLSSRYPKTEFRATSILPMLGAILLGVGIILFFAANWPIIPVAVKLILILSALFTCHYFAYKYRYEKNNVWLGNSLLLLGGILFGAAIFLIAQIYNINAYYPNGILFWGLGVLLMAWVTGERSVTILAILLLLAWTISDGSETHSLIPWLHLLILFLLAFPLAYRVRSASAVFLCQVWLVIALLMSISLNYEHMIPLVIIFLGSAFYLRGRHGEDLYGLLYVATGMIMVLTTMLIFSLVSDWELYVIIPVAILLGAMLVGFITLLLLPAYRHIRMEIAAVGLINLMFVSYLTFAMPHLFIYFVLFAAIVLVILKGAGQHNRIMLNLGLLFFYATVLCGYFDYASRYMDRSLFFIIGGVLLLLMGWWLNRKRDRIVSTWRDGHE
ncbi:MAG TPA: hypothetical protein DD791_09710 [Syntrophomonas sp.]|jgi:uncharacterized membrane protein|nr:hypothetical protein [Syntrophomonas sp.]